MTMKKIHYGLLLACLLGSSLSQAERLEPTPYPLDPALLARHIDTRELEVRKLPLAQARELLASTEAPVWRVLDVQSTACDVSPKEKDYKKKCKPAKELCTEATRFAEAYGKHATCSALYAQTQVLLVNDANPANWKKVVEPTVPPVKKKAVRKAASQKKPAFKKDECSR